MFDQTFADWFWVRVDKSAGPDECWYYGQQFETYATVSYKGRSYAAHKVAHILVNGPVPDGQVVMHTECDNPPCCNPAHTKSGTYAENTRDARNKGRLGVGYRWKNRRH